MQERNTEDVFKTTEDDDFAESNASVGVAIGNQMINKQSIMGDVVQRMEIVKNEDSGPAEE